MSQNTKSFLENSIIFNKNNISNTTKSLYFKDNIFYSYKEIIAHKDKQNNIIKIYNKTAKGNKFFSYTTSKHIGSIKRFCKFHCIDYKLINV
jgi:hypothetical protein